MTLSENLRKLVNRCRVDQTQKNYTVQIQKGHIPLDKALASNKFKKLAWDMYKKIDEPENESIWTLADINGEPWLVLYTDSNEQIIRGVQATILEGKLKKTASQAVLATHIGDVVEITATKDSINRKYNGVRGEVIAAYPERSQLGLDDGYTMWFENKDLALVRSANILDLGDTVRLKKNTKVAGKVEKINANAITFRSKTGISYSARITDIEKLTALGQQTVVVWTDDPKMLKHLVPGSTTRPEDTDLAPVGAAGEGPHSPPVIKAQPSPSESQIGSAVSAEDVVKPSVKQLAAAEIENRVYGRTLNVGDRVLNKVTGQHGTILTVNVDRKLGKYYTIDYGGAQPKQEFETTFRKESPAGVKSEQPPLSVEPTLSHPGQLLSRVCEELGITKKAYDGGGIESLRGGGGPGGNSAMQPMTWEVRNTESENEEANAMNAALNEAVDEIDLGSDNKINIEIDPETKKITIDLGNEQNISGNDTTVQPQQPQQPQQQQPQPGSPVTPTPKKTPESEFGRSDIGVEF